MGGSAVDPQLLPTTVTARPRLAQQCSNLLNFSLIFVLFIQVVFGLGNSPPARPRPALMHGLNGGGGGAGTAWFGERGKGGVSQSRS